MEKLVYVWIGDKLPEYAKISLDISRRTSRMPIVLISNKKIGTISGVDEQIFIEDFYSRPLKLSNLEKKLEADSVDYFWLKTIERFFIICQYLEYRSESRIFHAELDNLVFNILELADKLDSIKKGIFIPYLDGDYASSSLIYINSLEAMKNLCDFALNSLEGEFLNDMQILARFAKKSELCGVLPSEGCIGGGYKKGRDFIDPDLIGGIFDIARLGQFLFGVDLSNSAGVVFNRKNISIGKLILSLDRLRFDVNIESGYALVYDLQREYNLYNLHVHSKIFSQLINGKRLEKIVKRINYGKRTMIFFNLGKIFINFIILVLEKLSLKKYVKRFFKKN